MRSILVPVEDHDRMDAVLSTALLFAQPFASTIEGVPLGPDTADMIAADFSMSGVIFDDKTRRAMLKHAADTFEGFMASRGVPRRSKEVAGPSFSWLGEALVSPAGVGAYGRTFDILVVGRPGAGSHEPRSSTLEGALFESGRPLLIVPPEAPTTIGSSIAIAWNRSVETARSIAFAMPLLQRARDVIVMTVPGARTQGPDDAQVARGLCRHGIPARVLAVAEQGRKPARVLLETAAELGCDLMIKGGFTEGRLRQMIFGGVTSDILAEARVPVFMAH